MAEKLTVLIPCKNEEKNLRPCIESVEADNRRAARSRLRLHRPHEEDSARAGGPDHRARVRELGGLQELGDPPGRARLGACRGRRRARDAGTRRGDQVGPFRHARPRRLPNLPPQLLPRPPGHALRVEQGQRHPALPPGRLPLRGEARPRRPHREHRPGGPVQGEARTLHVLVFRPVLREVWALHHVGAEDLRARGRRTGLLSLALRPAWRFFQHYVLQLGFLEGKKGLIVSALGAFSVFTRYAKLWAIERGLPQPDPERAREDGGESTG